MVNLIGIVGNASKEVHQLHTTGNDPNVLGKHSVPHKKMSSRFMAPTFSSSKQDTISKKTHHPKMPIASATTSGIARAGNWMSSAAKRVGIRRTSRSAPTGTPFSLENKSNKRNSRVVFTRKTSAEVKRVSPRPTRFTSKPLTSPPNKPLPATPGLEAQSTSSDQMRGVVDARDKIFKPESPVEREKVQEASTPKPAAQELAGMRKGSLVPLTLGRNNPFNIEEQHGSNEQSQVRSSGQGQWRTQTHPKLPTRNQGLQTIKLVPNASPPPSDIPTPSLATSSRNIEIRDCDIPQTEEGLRLAQSPNNTQDSLDFITSKIRPIDVMIPERDSKEIGSHIQLLESKDDFLQITSKADVPNHISRNGTEIRDFVSHHSEDKENSVTAKAIPDSIRGPQGQSITLDNSEILTPAEDKINTCPLESIDAAKHIAGPPPGAKLSLTKTVHAIVAKSTRSSASTQTRSGDLSSDGGPASTIATDASGRVSRSSEADECSPAASIPCTIGMIISERIKQHPGQETPTNLAGKTLSRVPASRVPIPSTSVKTPIRQFSTKRLSGASCDYGPLLKIYSSAEKVIMGGFEAKDGQIICPSKQSEQSLRRSTTTKLKQFGQNSAARSRSMSPLRKSASETRAGRAKKRSTARENHASSHNEDKALSIGNKRKYHALEGSKIPVPHNLCGGALNPKRLTPVRKGSHIKSFHKAQIKNESAPLNALTDDLAVTNAVSGDPFIDSSPKLRNTIGRKSNIASKTYRLSSQSSISLDEASWIAPRADRRGTTLSRAITVSPVSSKSGKGLDVITSPISSIRMSQDDCEIRCENLEAENERNDATQIQDRTCSRKITSVRSKKERPAQEQTPFRQPTGSSENEDSIGSGSKSFPTRSSSRAPVPNFTIAELGEDNPKHSDETSRSSFGDTKDTDPPSEFVYRQNRLGAEHGLETHDFLPSQNDNLDLNRSFAIETSKEPVNSLPKSLFNVRGLFHRAQSVETSLLVDRKLQPRANKRPTILRGYPFPRTSEIHPLHRPTKSPSPNNEDSNGEPTSAYKLELTVPVTPAKEDPCDVEIDKLQHMALHMMSRVKHEPRFSRRSDYLDISKIMVDTILNVREAKKAAEEAKAASRRAEVSQLLCEKHLQEMMAMTSRIGDEMLRSSW